MLDEPGDLFAQLDLSGVERARERLRGHVLRTPLVRLAGDASGAGDVHLKLENLQPIGSFKLRGAGNRLLAALEANPDALARGVVTASAGNMAQGVAWHARRLEVPCHVVVPDHAPRAKLDAIERLGGVSIPVSFDEWWRTLERRSFGDLEGLFVHPVSDASVILGNGTIGLELLEDLPEVDTVLVPFGGGGLSSGIATVLRTLRPEVRVLAVEVETAAPLTAALAAGAPVPVEYHASFVDGIGGKGMLAEMWPLASALLDGTIVVSLAEVADAIRRLALHNQVIAEGAGAASVAAALRGRDAADRPLGQTACIVSGGNIDATVLTTILGGQLP